MRKKFPQISKRLNLHLFAKNSQTTHLCSRPQGSVPKRGPRARGTTTRRFFKNLRMTTRWTYHARARARRAVRNSRLGVHNIEGRPDRNGPLLFLLHLDFSLFVFQNPAPTRTRGLPSVAHSAKEGNRRAKKSPSGAKPEGLNVKTKKSPATRQGNWSQSKCWSNQERHKAKPHIVFIDSPWFDFSNTANASKNPSPR